MVARIPTIALLSSIAVFANVLGQEREREHVSAGGFEFDLPGLPYGLEPRMLIIGGCEQSTATFNMLASLIERITGKCFTTPWKDGELLHEEKNHDFSEDSTMGQAIATNAATVYVKSCGLLFKGEPYYVMKYPSVRHALVAMEARRAFVYRWNIIDQFICMAVDCFGRTEYFQPVFENGTESELCFARRHSPLKVLVRFQKPAQTIQALQETLRRHVQRATALEDAGYGYTPAIARTEDLLAFEYSCHDKMHSARSWQVLLAALGFGVDLVKVGDQLNDCGIRPPPPSHREKIHNFDEFHTALKNTRGTERLLEMVRM